MREIVSAEQVIECVTRAWASETYNAQLQSILLQEGDSLEASNAKEFFLGKKWQDIDDSALRQTYPSPFLIGNAAIRYYLGAFLISAVRKPNDANVDLMDQLVEFELQFPRKTTAIQRFRARFDLLTCDQKKAVACFLQFCQQYYSAFNDRACRRIEYSIDNYWTTGCLNGDSKRTVTEPSTGEVEK